MLRLAVYPLSDEVRKENGGGRAARGPCTAREAIRVGRGAVAICVENAWMTAPAGGTVVGSGCEVNWDLAGGLLGEALPSVDLAHGDLARREQGPEQHRCCLG